MILISSRRCFSIYKKSTLTPTIVNVHRLAAAFRTVSRLVQCSHHSSLIQMMTLLEDCFSSAGYIMDIIKELAKVLKDDLTPRKKSTKLMIQTSSPDKQQR
ncbi:hypothetical protein HID58_079996 [Brassica napus]|uniref:Uncharacterized protein n=1 Tax=Brassica napus TaxID=3708 RepID=A0ABQ7Y6Q0_BRANA|nr:hypothetical protein HID58_079996 [Brassica napus]